MIRPALGLLALVLAALRPVVGGEAGDPLLALPDPGRPRPVEQAFAPDAGTLLGPGVRLVAGGVVLSGQVLMDQGPTDGLEVLACLPGGKNHEALVLLDSTSGAVIKAACIAAFGDHQGIPAEEARGVPARGLPLRLTAHWRTADGRWQAIDASCLVRDRISDRAYPPLPWIYTGSRIVTVNEHGPEGRPVPRERFMLDITKSVAVAYDEADALLASPFPVAAEDSRFEANSAVVPVPRTRIWLALSAWEPALRLHADAAGALSLDGGAAVDDAGLSELFQRLPAGGLRAVLVTVPDQLSDPLLTALRARLLAQAARSRTWLVPVFNRG